MPTDTLTLSELTGRIRETIEGSFPKTYLVTAEISSFRADQKGHCYMEFIERDENTIVAQIRATMWSYRYRAVAREFKTATGMKLDKGIKILAEVEVSYHERYGLSLNLHDIDPSYTLGEMALRRKEILERLAKEGVIDKNKEVDFPLLPLKLAIISSPKAAGYEDFRNHIETNPYGYRLEIKLMKAIMQGDNAEASILEALNKCSYKSDLFDVIVIIRGGGGEADLHCFDSYNIGKAIAMIRIPVISGIGHFRDRSVVDEVAHTAVKTPTAAAELIIRTVREFEMKIHELKCTFADNCRALLRDRRLLLHQATRDMQRHVTRLLVVEEGNLGQFTKSLMAATKLTGARKQQIEFLETRHLSYAQYRVADETKTLMHKSALLRSNLNSYLNTVKAALNEKQIHLRLVDPRNVLKRGYSITSVNGSALKDTQKLSADDIIETILYNGEIKSRVIEVRSNGKKEATEI
jgi:exodeoxyribonuclease VII large subunit